jgi:hypothetical protein
MRIRYTAAIAIAVAAAIGSGCGASSSSQPRTPAEKACAADLSNLPAAYKLARHAGLGLGPNIYLAMHAPSKKQRAAALQRFEETCQNVAG